MILPLGMKGGYQLIVTEVEPNGATYVLLGGSDGAEGNNQIQIYFVQTELLMS